NLTGPRIQYHHWLVMNIPGGGPIAMGQTILPYAPPTPPAGTGPHRYVLILCKQPARGSQVTLQPGQWRSQREGWTVRDFIGAHNLAAQPIVGNFFIAQA